MKLFIVPLLLIANICSGQGWEAEVMAGTSGYIGDLTEKLRLVNTLRPAANFNVKYNFDNIIIMRAGISWINVAGNDKNNKREDLKRRNLNFKSTVWEANICGEINLLEPRYFYSYPYVFFGVGIFHFDPYTYDKDNKKTYLQPLGTEGQGISGYPNRKTYSTLQLCLPLGAGWKLKLNDKYDVIYEFGYRILFTDYLDDVSTTYVRTKTLLESKGPKTAELAYREDHVSDDRHPYDGKVRGNPKIKDSYFFTGVKLLMRLSRD
ncbi:MAG: DUF6089 family protein [Ginsengibacter sp.]